MADRPGMHSFLVTLGYGFAALLSVAMLVALWEHARRQEVARLPPPLPAPTRAAQVDVDVSMLDAGPPDGDQGLRQTTVDGALQRMSRASPPMARDSRAPWTETRPMVSPGPAIEPQAETERH